MDPDGWWLKVCLRLMASWDKYGLVVMMKPIYQQIIAV
jgi:hypothetical protein